MNLTALKVARATKPGRYGDGHGLYLQVTKRGVKSWLLRYERAGRERWMGLGPLHTIGLSDARELARQARHLLLSGVDPVEARKARKAAQAAEVARAITFEEATRQYFDAHAQKWRNTKHRAQFLSTLRTYAFPKIGKLPITEVDLGRVLSVLEPIWHDRTETASRVRGRIESILDWAAVRGYRKGENPARWRGQLQHVLPARGQIARRAHHPALIYTELPQFLSALRERQAVAAKALEFTILTAARTGEVIGAKWDEIDFAAKVWTIGADRMKAGREHRVPLTDRALELLKSLPREGGNDYMFIGPRAGGLSNMAMSVLLRRMGRANITVHGFRSTFRDWAAERTNFANHVVEMALAHAVGNKVEAAYRRGDLFDKRRRLMADWARYCTSRTTATGNVIVPMRAAG